MASGIENASGVQFAQGQAFYDEYLTNFFLALLADARNNSTVWWNMVKKVPATTATGRFIVFPVRTTRNTGRNFIRPGGLLPDPGSQGGAHYSTEVRTFMGRVKIDGESLRRGKTNGGAYITPEQLEVDGQLDDMQVDMNRVVHNDGSGRLAQILTYVGTTVTLVVNQSIEGAATCLTPPTLYLEVGDRIAFYLPGGTGTETVRTVTATGNEGVYVLAKLSANTIQVASSPGGTALNIADWAATAPAAGDWLVRASTENLSSNTSGIDTAAQNEMMGLAGIFSDTGVLDGQGASGAQQAGANAFGNATQTNFQGIATTTSFPWNRAVVLDNGGVSRTNSTALMQQAVSDAEEQNNANIELMLSGYATYNQYDGLLDRDKRYNNTLELTGGHKVLTFNGLPWFKDRYCYANRIYFVAMDQLQYMETEPLQTLNPLGVGVWERLKDKDAYFMGHVMSGQFITVVRQRVGALLCDLAA